ncbi:hypothetical protein pipiens_004763 [Culex pipiens pipiens]|uniref:RRM domain-containing protein n=1 Tax=Culex pipiens pipiens TaxID=38569 RepID=A0ABD1CF79_CULPP
MSQHDLIFGSLDFDDNPAPMITTYRDYVNFDAATVENAILAIPWSDFFASNEPDLLVNFFNEQVKQVHDAYSSIFIGNAPIGIKVEKIKAHFLKTYPHISAIIYIDFIDAEAARNACQENQKIFEGKRLRVSLARERKPINKEATLFVGNLKYSTSEEQLFDEFVEFGEIDMVRIIAGKGFGFVHFADPASVDKAAVKNKIKFNGREIHVERSRPPIQKESSEQESIDRAIASQNLLKKQQAPGGYLNYRRNQTRNQLALELLERVINVQCRRPKSGIKF